MLEGNASFTTEKCNSNPADVVINVDKNCFIMLVFLCMKDK